METLSVREMQRPDVDAIVRYWTTAEPDYLRSLGADPEKVPAREDMSAMLAEQLSQPYAEKKSYCIIWEVDGQPVGHSNVNKIVFGEEAYMHLHIWDPEVRKKGFGTALIRLTVPYFFQNLRLKTLYCEPYALNPAPNKTLEKAGFEFLRSYTTIPGWINFEQPVNLWAMRGSGEP